MDLPLALRVNRLYCLQCNARFPSENSLLNHVASHALKTRCVVRLERLEDSKKGDSNEPVNSVHLGDVDDVEPEPERFVAPVKLKRVKRRKQQKQLGRFVPNWNPRKKRRTAQETFTIAKEVVANTACEMIEKLGLNEPALQFMDCRSDALDDLNNSQVLANKDPDNSPVPAIKDLDNCPVPANKDLDNSPVPAIKDLDNSPVPANKDPDNSLVPAIKDLDNCPVPAIKDLDNSPVPANKDPDNSPVPAIKDLDNCPVPANKDLDNSSCVVNKDHPPVESECLVVDGDGEDVLSNGASQIQIVSLSPGPLDNDDCANSDSVVSNTEPAGKTRNESTEPVVAPETVLNTVNLQYPNLSAEGVHVDSTAENIASSASSEICWSEATTGIGENGKTGICPICKEQTLTDYDLLKHLEDHCAQVEVPEIRFKCIYYRCNKEFKMKGHLTRHYNATGHAFPCRFCSLVVKTKSALAEHEQTQHAKKLKQIEIQVAAQAKAKTVMENIRGSENGESSAALHQSTPELQRAYEARPTGNVLEKTGDDAEKDTVINVGHPVIVPKRPLQETSPAVASIRRQNANDVIKIEDRSMLNGSSSYETSNLNMATAIKKSTTNFEIQKTQSQPYLSRTVNMNGSGVSYSTASPDRPKLTVPLESVIKHFTSNGDFIGPVQLTPQVTLCPATVDTQPPIATSQQQLMKCCDPSVSTDRMPPIQRGQISNLQRPVAAPNRFPSDPVFMQPVQRAMQSHGSISSMQNTGPGIGNARFALQQHAARNLVAPMRQCPERLNPPAYNTNQLPTSIATQSSTINVSLSSSVQYQGPHASIHIPSYVATTRPSQQYLQHAQPPVLLSQVMHLHVPAQCIQPQSVIQVHAPGTEPRCSVATTSNVSIPVQPGESDWGVQYVTRYNSSDPISTTVPSSNLNIGQIVSPTSGVLYCPTTSRELADQHCTAQRLGHNISSVLCNPVSAAAWADGPRSSVHLLRSHHNSRKSFHCAVCGASAQSYQGYQLHRQFCELLRTCKVCMTVFPNFLKLCEHQKDKCMKHPDSTSHVSRPSEAPASTSKDVQQQHRHLNNTQHIQERNEVSRNPLSMHQLPSSLQPRPVASSINLSKVTISLPSPTTVSMTVSNPVTQCVSTVSVVDHPAVPCVLPTPSKSAPEIQMLPTSTTDSQKDKIQCLANSSTAVTSPIRDHPSVIIVDVEDDCVNISETCIPRTENCKDQNQEKLQVDAQETEPFLVTSVITTVSKTAYEACPNGKVLTDVSPNHDSLSNGLDVCNSTVPTSTADVNSEDMKETKVEMIPSCATTPIKDKISTTEDRSSVLSGSTSSSDIVDISSTVANQASADNNLPEHVNALPDAKDSVGEVTPESHSAIPGSPGGRKDVGTSEANESGSSKKVQESLPEDSICNDNGSISKSSSTLSCYELLDIEMDIEIESESANPTAPIVQLGDVDDSGDCKLVLSDSETMAATTTICQVCDREFPTVELFDEHWSVHLQASERQCIKCAKKFANKVALFKHFRSHLRSCQKKVPRKVKISIEKNRIILVDASEEQNWLVPVVDADTYRRYGSSFENVLQQAKFVTMQHLRRKLRNEEGDIQVPAVPPW